ncbi:MAG: hypothetical protein QXS69_01345 [Candidatus Aenigmatarchaeota archaeon]
MKIALEINVNLLVFIIVALAIIIFVAIALNYLFKTSDFFYFAREICLRTVGKIFGYSKVCGVFNVS